VTSNARGHTLYTSPCVGYSAHPTYTPLIKTGKHTAAQVLLQVRVDQERVYNRLKTTLNKLHWKEGVPFEVGYGLDDVMEWLVADRDAVVVTGILFRELGQKSKSERAMYGKAACDFMSCEDGPEYKWTEHLANSIEAELSGNTDTLQAVHALSQPPPWKHLQNRTIIDISEYLMEWDKDSVPPVKVNDFVTVKQNDDMWLLCEVCKHDKKRGRNGWITAEVREAGHGPEGEEAWEEGLGVRFESLVCFQVCHVEEVD